MCVSVCECDSVIPEQFVCVWVRERNEEGAEGRKYCNTLAFMWL